MTAGPATDHHITLAISSLLLGLAILDARSEMQRPVTMSTDYIDYLIDVVTAAIERPVRWSLD